jgi:RNA polymerase sigma-70 factor (ECF subfamily)
MLRAWSNIDGLHPDIGKLRPWLFTVARRLAIDAGRARLARPKETHAVDMEVLPTSDDPIDRMLGADAVKTALAHISPKHRHVIIEVYYRGRSAAETAVALGIPEGTVKSRTYHALRSLRAVLG